MVIADDNFPHSKPADKQLLIKLFSRKVCDFAGKLKHYDILYAKGGKSLLFLFNSGYHPADRTGMNNGPGVVSERNDKRLA